MEAQWSRGSEYHRHDGATGRSATDTGQRSLVWGVYLTLSSDDALTNEVRTPALPIHFEDDGRTKTVRGENWSYAWVSHTTTPQTPSSAEGVILERSGFGFPGGNLIIKMWLEPRILVGCGNGQTYMARSGRILFMERRVRADQLIYGASVDSKEHGYRNPCSFSNEKHVRARRNTLSDGLEPPLFSPRKDVKTHTLHMDEGRGRLKFAYDACKYFDAQCGGEAGQILIAHAWLELDDPKVLCNAAASEDHRVVCKINLGLRSDESNRLGESSQKTVGVYLGRPQRIETSGIGRVRTLQWLSYLDTEYRRREHRKSPSFPGIRLNSADGRDEDTLEEFMCITKAEQLERKFLEEQEQEQAIQVSPDSSEVEAMVSARFLDQKRVFMPDNDALCNIQLVLPTKVLQGSTVTFKFYNLRHAAPISVNARADKHHHGCIETTIRWTELATVHTEYLKANNTPSPRENGGGDGGGSRKSQPIPVPQQSLQDSPTFSRHHRMSIGKKGGRRRRSSRRSPRSKNTSPREDDAPDLASSPPQDGVVFHPRSRSGSLKNLLKHKRSTSAGGGGIIRSAATAVVNRRNTGVDSAIVKGVQNDPMLRYARKIGEKIHLNVLFTATTTAGSSPRTRRIVFEILSTSLIINDYTQTLRMDTPIRVQSM